MSDPRQQLFAAIAHYESGRLDEAERLCAALVQELPKSADVLHLAGLVAYRRGELGRAAPLLERAVEAAPKAVQMRANLVACLADAGSIRKAIAQGEAALRLDPANAQVYINVGHAMLAAGMVGEALVHFRTAYDFDPSPQLLSNILYAQHFLDVSPEALASEHRAYGERYGGAGEATVASGGSADPDRRLRVGYLSPDMRAHSVASFFVPLIEAHDRAAVEVFCYADVARPDAVTERIRAAADSFSRTFGVSDEALAARIAADGIDVLVDLAGHTDHNRLPLFARRPAPVQVSYLGYPDTTGLKAIGYRLTDALADPDEPAVNARATEQLVRIAGGFLCYQPPGAAPDPSPPPCEASGAITFGSFNNVAKLSTRTIEAWAKVLRGVPGSKLLLKAAPLGDEAGRKRVIDAFAAQRIAPDRLVLEGRTPGLREHLGAYGRVDVALDPFPYNGTTTTCEALWMGVPVVALAGDRHCARVGASLLTTIGLPDLVAGDVKAYVATAVALAQDRSRLIEARRTLRARVAASPLGDARRLAREIERAYRAMWRAHLEGAGEAADIASPAKEQSDVAKNEWVEMCGALRVSVPASLDLITPYVLREQRDWFEAEISFVRRMLDPGMRVIDVGANHGVYALTAARLVGPAGRVWAFEPEARTAARLRASAQENGLSRLEIHEIAISNRDGEATLHAHESSELSSLLATEVEGSHERRVKVRALDGLATEIGIDRVDLLKLDAEGEEERVIEGAAALLARARPLVMFEIKHGDRLNLDLVERLAKRGFAPYRLIEGLGALVPFDAKKPLDRFQLNLFACPDSRAEELERAGLLTRTILAREALPEVDPRLFEVLLDRTAYAHRLRDRWKGARPGRADHQRALSIYALAHVHGRRDVARSFAALSAAFDALLEAAGAADTMPRLLSVARVAAELGERSFAVRVLGDVLARFESGRDLALDEPFLAPSPRFDAVAIKDRAEPWCLAAAIEQHERLRAFSSFISGPSSIERLELVQRLGYGSEEITRRLEVARRRWPNSPR